MLTRGRALLGVSEPASVQTSDTASHSTPWHTLPNLQLFHQHHYWSAVVLHLCVHAIPGRWGLVHTSGMDMLLKVVPVGGALLQLGYVDE